MAVEQSVTGVVNAENAVAAGKVMARIRRTDHEKSSIALAEALRSREGLYESKEAVRSGGLNVPKSLLPLCCFKKAAADAGKGWRRRGASAFRDHSDRL